jgi:GT2 family glycosyltransferase
MDISFIILSWNSEQYLDRCLASIQESLRENKYSYEILVLDNGSIDGSKKLLRDISKGNPSQIIPYFENNNIGTTRSRNKMFTDASGDYLCVMDSDVELSRGVLDILVPMLQEKRELGIVVPKILYPSGKWQKSFDKFPTIIDKINRFFRLRSIERLEALEVCEATASFYIDYAISAFWLMRKDILKYVGTLDENIFYSPEDIDFCLRTWKTGYRILYVPYVSVRHHTQEISRGFKINKAKLSHTIGLCYFFLKHRYLLRRPKINSTAHTGLGRN